MSQREGPKQDTPIVVLRQRYDGNPKHHVDGGEACRSYVCDQLVRHS